ncbi:MAG: hypothetical protein ACJ77C_00215 [Chloroflexota bacterium]
MSRRWWVLLGALAVAVVVLGAAFLGRAASDPTPSRPPIAEASPPAATASLIPAATASVAPTSSSEPSASAGPALPSTAAKTPAPRASGPPRLAYAAFLRRVNDDRATVERLNAALSSAAQAQDPAAVRRAAVDILDFVDTERDWLRENPPADCHAAAHASAGAMLDAYGAAADAFIAWAQTGGGLAGIGALSEALDAAQTASDALTAFTRAIETTTCPA